jgi:hypothetical protein
MTTRPSMGRPADLTFSVARLLGLCLLQEWNDMSDQEALDTFSFDVRWRYAVESATKEITYPAVHWLISGGGFLPKTLK